MIRKILTAIAFSFLIFSAAHASQQTLTFKGSLTLITGETETEINGTKTILMPKPFMIELQDNHPGAIAEIFMNEGRHTERPAIAVRTSKPFTVKGKALREIFTLRGTGDNIKLLSIGKNNFTIPALTSDTARAIMSDYERHQERNLKLSANSTLWTL